MGLARKTLPMSERAGGSWEDATEDIHEPSRLEWKRIRMDGQARDSLIPKTTNEYHIQYISGLWFVFRLQPPSLVMVANFHRIKYAKQAVDIMVLDSIKLQ